MPVRDWKFRITDILEAVQHEYFGIDMNILWETIKNELPLMVSGLKGILADSKP